MIPKKIYQTWKTQNLPQKIMKLHRNFRSLNTHYDHILYTDEQMNDYMSSNADKELADIYWKMNHIVARADIWRYTILYNEGGIYVDIDSLITGSLDDLINIEDKAIITAETNQGLYAQWALIFEKKHIILENTLNNILRDIHQEKHRFDHHSLTVVNYANAISKVTKDAGQDLNWENIHKNTDMTIGTDSFTFRVFGVDYNEYFQFKHKYNHLLRGRPKGVEIDTHWSLQEQKPLY